MDTVWISKLLITLSLYFLLNLAYKKINWHAHSRNLSHSEKIIIAIIILTSIIPIIASFFVLFIIIILNKTYEYIDTRAYWEQIILFYGFIALYFYIRIKLDEIKKTHETQINKQRDTIFELQKEIKKLKANLKDNKS